ncbi:MAG: ATP synthase F1 subunit delta [Mariprofundaceae bacterium]
MSTRSVSRRYARALFELAGEGVKVRDDLGKLSEVVQVEQLAALVEDAQVTAPAKAKVLAKAAGKVSKESVRLLEMLCARGKASLLPEIAAIYDEIESEAAAEVVADVVVASRLTSGMQDKLAKAVGKAVGKKVRLNVSEDAAIIGGLVISIGDRQIDHSLRNVLEGMRRAIAA